MISNSLISSKNIFLKFKRKCGSDKMLMANQNENELCGKTIMLKIHSMSLDVWINVYVRFKKNKLGLI